MKKRIFSVFLALVLCLSLLPGITPTAKAEAAVDIGLTHMNIFGGGTNLIGRHYPFARYDSLISDLLDEEGRQDYETEAEEIRYRKAGVMFQAASLEASSSREYFFTGSGSYEVVFYANKKLDPSLMEWKYADTSNPDSSRKFYEWVIGDGEDAIYSYRSWIHVPESSTTASLYYNGSPVVTLTLTLIDESETWVTNCMVDSFREQEPGIFSELTLELFGFNLPSDPSAYALYQSYGGDLLAKASQAYQVEIAYTCDRTTVVFSFEDGMSYDELISWPDLYINGNLSYYYAKPEDRNEERFHDYGFVQLPNCYSGLCATGLEAVNLTNAAARNIEMHPIFSGGYDYPPEKNLSDYAGLGMYLFPSRASWQYTYEGNGSPAYWLARSGANSIHELYLYGYEKLDLDLLKLSGVDMVEPFTVSVFGDGGWELYTYRAVISVPAAGGTIGLSYNGCPLVNLPAYRVSGLDEAQVPIDWDIYDSESPTEFESYPAPLVCTCWTSDVTLENGVMTDFDVALSGFNLPNGEGENDALAYELYCHEAADNGETFATAESVKVDKYGKTIVHFKVVDAKYGPCTCDLYIYGRNMIYCTYTGNKLPDGSGYITDELRLYGGMRNGVGVRVFSPYNVLGKNYEKTPVTTTWNEDDSDTVSITANITSWDLQRNDLRAVDDEPSQVMVVMAVYNEAGRMIGVVTKTITEPELVTLTLSSKDAQRACLFVLDLSDGCIPIKSMLEFFAEEP